MARLGETTDHLVWVIAVVKIHIKVLGETCDACFMSSGDNELVNSDEEQVDDSSELPRCWIDLGCQQWCCLARCQRLLGEQPGGREF